MQTEQQKQGGLGNEATS